MFPPISRDAFMSATSASFAPASGLEALDLDSISRNLLQRASVPAPDKVVTPATEPVWNFIPMDAHPVTQSEDTDPELERYLVEEITRAKRRRPLMRRLARIEDAYAELPGGLRGPAPSSPPPPLPRLGPLDPMGPPVAPLGHDSLAHEPVGHEPLGQRPTAKANGTHIDQLMEEFGDDCVPPPPSAAWLQKARRERRRARLRTALAWFATLIIGATIISATMQALQH
jgi:hypothetical protein